MPRSRVQAGSKSEPGPDLFERDAVVAFVRERVIGHDLGVGRLPVDELGDVAQSVVLRVAPDVEDFARDHVDRRPQRHRDCSRNVLDVHEGPPLIGAVDGDRSIADGLGAKQVDDQVEARPTGNAVDGGEAQAGNREVAIIEALEHRFRGDLAAGIERLRIEMRLFVHDLIASTVDRTGAREDKSAHAARLGDFADDLGCRHIYVDCEIGIDRTGRIAHQPAEMDHRSNPAHRSGQRFDVTEVLADDGEFGCSATRDSVVSP